MAENIKEDLKQLEDKKERFSIQEATLPSSTVENTCTVHKQEEDALMENTEIKAQKQFKKILILTIVRFYVLIFFFNTFFFF